MKDEILYNDYGKQTLTDDTRKAVYTAWKALQNEREVMESEADKSQIAIAETILYNLLTFNV